MKVIALLAACVAAENVQLLVGVDPGTAGAECNATDKKCNTGLNCVESKCKAPGGKGDVCDPTTNKCADPFKCVDKKCADATPSAKK